MFALTLVPQATHGRGPRHCARPFVGGKDLRLSCRRAGPSPPSSTAGKPASHRTGDIATEDPPDRVDAAEKHSDSWWPDFDTWFADGGAKK
jgi:hypothetical protein